MGRGNGGRPAGQKIRRGRGDCRRVASSASAPRTASACTPRSSGRRTATRSCSRTASRAPSACGPTRSQTSPTTTASSHSITAAMAAARPRRAGSRYSLDHPGGRSRLRPRGDAGAGRARRHRRTLDGWHRDHVVGRSVSRPGAATRRCRRADQHDHRRPAAQCAVPAVPQPLADVRVRAAGTLLKTFGAAPLLRAVDRPSRRFVSTIAVGRDADPRSPNSSTSCSPRHRPPGAAAGPAPWLTRSVPSTSG